MQCRPDEVQNAARPGAVRVFVTKDGAYFMAFIQRISTAGLERYSVRTIGGTRRGAIFRRNRIQAAAMPWMTPAHASRREYAAFQDTVLMNCLDGVVRAARQEPAAWTEDRADDNLVAAQQQQEQCFHRAFVGPMGPTTRSAQPPMSHGDASNCRNSLCNRTLNPTPVAESDLLFTG